MSVFGLSRPVFHLTNLAIHTVTVVLLYTTARHRLHLPRPAALLAGALFSVQPVHSEAVAGLVGRADCLSSLLMMLAWRAGERLVLHSDMLGVGMDRNRNSNGISRP